MGEALPGFDSADVPNQIVFQLAGAGAARNAGAISSRWPA